MRRSDEGTAVKRMDSLKSAQYLNNMKSFDRFKCTKHNFIAGSNILLRRHMKIFHNDENI